MEYLSPFSTLLINTLHPILDTPRQHNLIIISTERVRLGDGVLSIGDGLEDREASCLDRCGARASLTIEVVGGVGDEQVGEGVAIYFCQVNSPGLNRLTLVIGGSVNAGSIVNIVVEVTDQKVLNRLRNGFWPDIVIV